MTLWYQRLVSLEEWMAFIFLPETSGSWHLQRIIPSSVLLPRGHCPAVAWLMEVTFPKKVIAVSSGRVLQLVHNQPCFLSWFCPTIGIPQPYATAINYCGFFGRHQINRVYTVFIVQQSSKQTPSITTTDLEALVLQQRWSPHLKAFKELIIAGGPRGSGVTQQNLILYECPKITVGMLWPFPDNKKVSVI